MYERSNEIMSVWKIQEVSGNNWISILAIYAVLAEVEFSLNSAATILPDNQW